LETAEQQEANFPFIEQHYLK